MGNYEGIPVCTALRAPTGCKRTSHVQQCVVTAFLPYGVPIQAQIAVCRQQVVRLRASVLYIITPTATCDNTRCYSRLHNAGPPQSPNHSSTKQFCQSLGLPATLRKPPHSTLWYTLPLLSCQDCAIRLQCPLHHNNKDPRILLPNHRQLYCAALRTTTSSSSRRQLHTHQP
jgi:hypothetical protein